MFWIRNWKVHLVVVLTIGAAISVGISASEFKRIDKKALIGTKTKQDNNRTIKKPMKSMDKTIRFVSTQKSNAQLIYQELQKYLKILLTKEKILSIKGIKKLELTKYQKSFSKLSNEEKTALETWTLDKLQNNFKIKCVQNFQKWKLKNNNSRKYPNEFKNWKTFDCNKIKNDLK